MQERRSVMQSRESDCDVRRSTSLMSTRSDRFRGLSLGGARACKHGEMGDAPELDSPVVGVNQPRRHLNLLGWIPRPLRHGITIFVALLFVEYVAIPSFLHSKARSSLNQLGRVNFGWFLAGFALEAAALVAYAAPDPVGAAQGRPRTLPSAANRPFHIGGKPCDPGRNCRWHRARLQAPHLERGDRPRRRPSRWRLRGSARRSSSTPCSGWRL